MVTLHVAHATAGTHDGKVRRIVAKNQNCIQNCMQSCSLDGGAGGRTSGKAELDSWANKIHFGIFDSQKWIPWV